MNLTPLYRKLVLSLATNRLVNTGAQRVGMRLGASRFVAGESLEQALAVVADLNQRAILGTLDYLGEGVHTERMAREMCQAYLDLLTGIQQAGVQANVSLKLTQLGLSFSQSLTEEILLAIVKKANEQRNFVRIDMEETPYTDRTLEIYHQLRHQGYTNVGTVVQAYLYRSEKDSADLSRINANLRVVKGAYNEPPHLAYPRKADVDESFKRIIKARLISGMYTGVATHDEQIVEFTKELVAQRGIDRNRFEFQMLYGVRMGWQEELAQEGYRMRCYVPYGAMWYPYFTRRIAERPGNLGFLIRNLLRK